MLTVNNPFIGYADWMATPGGVGPKHYPIDLGTGERHTRLPVQNTFWPFFNWLRGSNDPVKYVAPATMLIPQSSGYLRLFDLTVWSQAFGKQPTGPAFNAQPGVQSMTRFPDVVFPELPKSNALTRGNG